MLKRIFTAIVSVAMLFCMSVSMVGVYAEDSDSNTIDGEKNGKIVQPTSIGFYSDRISWRYDRGGEGNREGALLVTEPKEAVESIDVSKLEFSVSNPEIADFEGYTLVGGASVFFKKPGTIVLTVKYKGLEGKTTITCYDKKAPETLDVPESVRGYKGYTNYFDISFGEDDEVYRGAEYEVIEGQDIISLRENFSENEKCVFDGLAVGKAVIRVRSEGDKFLYKDVNIEITDELAPAPTLTIKADGKEVPVKNDSITVEKDVTLVFQYSYEAMPNEGGSDFLGIENLFNQVEASKILDIAGGGGGGGDIISSFRVAFRTVEYGSDTFEVLPGKLLTINVKNKPVTFTVKENPQGAVIVNGVEMKDGANTVESGIRTNMFTIPNPGYHFDYWIIDGEKTKGVFGSNGGLKLYPDKDLTVQAFFKACDDEEVRNAVKPTCTKTGYSGDVYCKTNNVLIKKGEVLPMTEHNYVDHICKECGAKEEVKEEKPEAPVTDTIKEEIVINVPETIPEEVAETIKETISDVKIENVVESIPEAVKKEMITKLLKDIDTTNKDVQIKVVNTVKVTAADLKSENKSITYEISPKAVVTVDGVEVKTADLKNDQLTGNKDIEVTLPINGLDLKEIVHKSEGYDPEYIYDFVISKEGTVTFKISHFSSFTLNEVITKPAEPAKGTVGTVSPNTGDHTEVMLYGGIGIVALIGALAVILFRRKYA